MTGTLIIRTSSFIFGIVFIGCLLASCVAKNKDTKLGPVIGIDLGTTYSRVGVYQNGHVEIIANDQGNRITHSWVAFSDNERLIGEAAKNHSAVNTEKTIFGVKKLIGRKFEDKEVQQDMKFVPYKIVNRDGKPFIEVQIKDRETKVFSPEEISAMLLRKMKETAEAYLGKEIKDAVVTIPAYFNDAQRKATQEAGTIAGINVVRIIDEPTAAAIAYGLDEKCIEKNILVFDLGGGTLDVSILDVDNRVFQVLATNGNTQLGGEYFDQRIMEYFIKLIMSKHGKDISKDSRAINKLRRECERAKIALSTQQEVRVEIKDLFDGMDFSEPLTRELFEVLNIDLFRKTIGPVKKVMEDAGLEKKQIDEIVLVGGSTKIPKIQQLLKDYFDGKELNVSSNPDEAVVYGAAIQAGILSGEGDDEIKDFLFWYGVPLPIGIETFGGVMTELIPSGSFIPVKRSLVFTTHHDQQTTVSIKFYEWDECRTWLIGKFYFTGIAPAPRGTPEIEITVIYSDRLHVKAEDKASGKFENTTITWRRRFHSKEAERMVKEGDEFALEDIHFKERINARNKLEKYVLNMRNQINDNDNDNDNYNLGDKLETDAKERIETTTKNALQWMEENQNAQKEYYEEKLKEVQTVCNPILNIRDLNKGIVL